MGRAKKKKHLLTSLARKKKKNQQHSQQQQQRGCCQLYLWCLRPFQPPSWVAIEHVRSHSPPAPGAGPARSRLTAAARRSLRENTADREGLEELGHNGCHGTAANEQKQSIIYPKHRQEALRQVAMDWWRLRQCQETAGKRKREKKKK